MAADLKKLRSKVFRMTADYFFKLKPHLQNKLVINYQDESEDSILSDDSWKSGTGHIRRSDILPWGSNQRRISRRVLFDPFD